MPLEPYDERAELEDIASRYERVFARLPRTLPRLRQDVIFGNLVRRLRGDGWRDWHIVQAVMNGVINWHLARMGHDRDPEAMKSVGGSLTRRLLEEGETAEDPAVPPAYFTPTTMELFLHTGLLTFLKRKGAVFRDRGYDRERMREIADERYHYLELDVPHPPLFPDDAT